MNGLELASLLPCTEPLPTPYSMLSPSRSQLVRSPQGTLDVFILIRLSLVVTFKPEQSSGTNRGRGDRAESQQSQKQLRKVQASTGGSFLLT